MEDEVLTNILEALESIDKRLALLELRSNYPMYTIPESPDYIPWTPFPPVTLVPCTGDPLPDLPITTCKIEEKY